MYKDIGKKILTRFGSVKAKKVNYDNACQDIVKFGRPNRGEITAKTSKYQVSDQRFVHPAGPVLINKTVANLAAGVANLKINRPTLGPAIQDLKLSTASKAWLEDASNKLLTVFNNPNCNFGNQTIEFLNDLVTFNTAALMVTEGDDYAPVRFKTRPIANIYIDEDYNGVVDTFFSIEKTTLRRMAQEFGVDTLSEKLQFQLAKSPDEDREVLCHMLPSRDAMEFYGISANDVYKNKQAEYTIIEMDMETCEILRIQGSKRFDTIVARMYKIAGEVYGCGPSFDALPLLKKLAGLQKLYEEVLPISVLPAFLTGDERALQNRSMSPGAIIGGALRDDGRPKIVPLQISNDPRMLVEAMELLKREVQDIFFQATLPEDKNAEMTAYETRMRVMERQKALAPMAERIQSEFLEPIVRDTFEILVDRGIINLSEMPDELKQQELKFSFTGYLATISKYAEVEAANALLSMFLPYAQINPEIAMLPDFVKMMRHAAHITGVPNSLIKSDEEVAAIRQQQAEAAQQQAQMAQAQNLNQTAGAISQLTRGQ